MIPFLKRHAFLLLFTLASAMRLAYLWRAPLWYDENFTLLMIRLPLERMWLAILGDVHPPLFYLLMWPLGQIPNMPVWIIRLPAALFSILALGLWWLLLKGLVSSSPVRWAAWLLMAVSSTQLFYAQEGRMYSLLTFLIIAATLALVRRKWFWLAVTSLALLYTHNYGIFYVACLWAAGLLRDHASWRPLTLAIGVACLNWLPWLQVLSFQMATIKPAYWIIPPTLGNSLYALYSSFFMHAELRTDVWNMIIFFGWLAFAIAWFVVYCKRVSCPKTLQLVLVMAFGTFGLALLASLLWSPLMLYRALVPLAPFVGLFMVLPLAQVIQNRRAAWLAAVLIVPLLVLNAARLYVKSPGFKSPDDYKVLQVVKYIDAHWQTGDVVFHLGDGGYVDMTPYAAHPAEHVKMTPCGPTRGELSPLTRLAIGEQITTLEALQAKRIWLFSNESPMTPQCEQDFVDRIAETLAPILCVRDDSMVNECLYLLENQD